MGMSTVNIFTVVWILTIIPSGIIGAWTGRARGDGKWWALPVFLGYCLLLIGGGVVEFMFAWPHH
jgi:hypothetical protein